MMKTLGMACRTGLVGVALASAFAAPSSARVLAAYEIAVFETAVDSQAWKQLEASCPADKKALGAGWAVLDPTGAILDGEATYFEPAFDGSSWIVNARNRSTFAPDWKLRVRLICGRT